MGPVATGLGEVFHYVVTGKGDDVTELRTIHDWVIRPELRTVQGTAEINSWGGYEKQYQVRIDPNLLIKYGLTFDQVVQAVEENNRNVGGGNIREGTPVGARPGPRPHGERRADQGDRHHGPATACRSACATWPRWPSATRSAAAP